MSALPAAPTRLLIDGKLDEGRGSRTFPTVNPATEEVLGQAADASPGDMDRAIAAARRVFDESGWADDLGLRVRCLRQLADALARHADDLRELTVAEVGAPLFLTYGAQLDTPAADLRWFADLAESHEWVRDLGVAEPMDHQRGRWADRPVVTRGGSRPCRKHHGSRSGSSASAR